MSRDDENLEELHEVTEGQGADWDRDPVPPGFERDASGALTVVPEVRPRDWNALVLRGPTNLSDRELWPGILEVVARTGRATAAAAHAGCTVQAIYQLRKRSQEFASLYEAAMDAYRGRLWAEVERRGYEGVTKPLMYKGVIVATQQEYDTTLLLAALRRADPEAREILAQGSKTTVNVSATANAANIVGSEFDGPRINLRDLTAEQRDALRSARRVQQLAPGTPDQDAHAAAERGSALPSAVVAAERGTDATLDVDAPGAARQPSAPDPSETTD